MSDEDWFEPKRFGYGAGLPIAWQGWALLAGYVGAVAVAGIAMPRRPVLFVALALILTIPLLIVSARHTRGGWRWRWGDDGSGSV